MKCPVCVAAGERSTVRMYAQGAGCFSAEGFYWDEDGDPHDHRYRVSADHYRCSNGHDFEVNRQLHKWPCPTCKIEFATYWEREGSPPVKVLEVTR